LIWVYLAIFATGLGIHLCLQAGASAKSCANSIGFWGYFHLNWYVLLARVFLSFMLFLLWHELPSFFEKVSQAVPMTMSTSGIVGFAADVLVDKLGAILGLTIDIPKAAPPPN
jgi:hypothetical protein